MCFKKRKRNAFISQRLGQVASSGVLRGCKRGVEMNVRRWSENEGQRCLREEESEKERALVHGDVSRMGTVWGVWTKKRNS